MLPSNLLPGLDEAGGGVEEVGGDPEDGPAFGVAAAEFIHVGHIAVLGEIGVLDLLALAAIGVGELVAGAVHYL